MVYGTYNYSIHGVYKPSFHHWGTAHCRSMGVHWGPPLIREDGPAEHHDGSPAERRVFAGEWHQVIDIPMVSHGHVELYMNTLW